MLSYSEFILTAVCGSDVTLWQPRQGLICFMTFCHFMTFVDKQTGRNKNRDVNVYLEQGPWLILGGYTKQQKANKQVWIISPAISQCKCGTSAWCGLRVAVAVVWWIYYLHCSPSIWTVSSASQVAAWARHIHPCSQHSTCCSETGLMISHGCVDASGYKEAVHIWRQPMPEQGQSECWWILT